METFTQDQVNEQLEAAKKEWQEKELTPVQSELDKYKPKELSDDEKKLQEDLANFKQEKVNFALEKAGLTDFAEFLQVEDMSKLDETVNKFKALVDGIKADTKKELGYKPSNHKQDDEYSTYVKNNDVKGMVGTKLSKLFN
ncbi:hypothetical protein ACQKJC_24725 [Priestia koreensis]|uniref:hypothetical protein n=1 Tax=Priestia koreensis TaxID=284581 RepID=UPI003D025527